MNAIASSHRNGYGVVILIFISGLFQGLTLVSFPALGVLLKTSLGLTDIAYGFIFLPQVALTALGALFGGVLAKRLGLPGLLKLSLAANGLSQLALLSGIGMNGSLGYPLIVLGTSLLGLGFGLSAAPLNRYPVILFPSKPDSALTGLHTLIGTGFSAGPLAIGLLMESGWWRTFPVSLTVAALALLLSSLLVQFPVENTDNQSEGASRKISLMSAPAFWLLFATAAVYAFCEGLFSNWAVIFLQEDKLLSPKTAGVALSAFWATLAIGRLLTSWLVFRLSATAVWLCFPVSIACAFIFLPQVDSAASGIVAYAFAGLACSGFFPLTVGRAASRFPQHSALISSLMVAALMMGVGIGSFALGPLRTLLPLSAIFQLAAALPVVVFGMGIFSLFASQNPQDERAPNEAPLRAFVVSDDDIVICPACGGENPKDAVFCENPACHKALGEFKYVLEELMAEKNWIERIADRVTAFVSKPHFITLHTLWFILWIVLNSGLIGFFQHFDEYPYSLLGIILSIEAILITGFLLISQNHQTAYSEKRAELDYEINIRSYRKLIELERRLYRLTNNEPGGDSR